MGISNNVTKSLDGSIYNPSIEIGEENAPVDEIQVLEAGIEPATAFNESLETKCSNNFITK